MAYQKDYILRMLEQIGEIIAKLKGLIEENKQTAASEQLNLATEKIFGKSISVTELLNHSSQALFDSVTGSETEKWKKVEYLADILTIHATHFATDLSQRQQSIRLAFDLLSIVSNSQPNRFDLLVTQKMNNLQTQLRSLEK